MTRVDQTLAYRRYKTKDQLVDVPKLSKLYRTSVYKTTAIITRKSPKSNKNRLYLF